MQLTISITGTMGRGDGSLPPGMQDDVTACVRSLVEELRGLALERASGDVAFELSDATVTLD
jgi:hypothetical protein